MKKLLLCVLLALMASAMVLQAQEASSSPKAGVDGNKYVPYERRTGNESVVYFTRDLSANGLIKAYEQVSEHMTGRVGVKLHTGEPQGPNIIPHEWVQALLAKALPEATIVETNTYYRGGRYTTEYHRKTLKVNGWTFCPVDILDEQGTTLLPVNGGKWFKDEQYFLSSFGKLTKFGKLVKFMMRSIMKRVPGIESDYDRLDFVEPANVMVQAEGEYTKFENVRRIEVGKSKKALLVVMK